jgi:hypothetical protein
MHDCFSFFLTRCFSTEKWAESRTCNLGQANKRKELGGLLPEIFRNKICSINVCGLKSKLLLPDFDDLIKCHDICIFLESKIDDLDILNLPNGYRSFSKCRQKFCKKSGGITIKVITVLTSDHKR